MEKARIKVARIKVELTQQQQAHIEHARAFHMEARRQNMSDRNYDGFLGELDDLVGLNSIKDAVRDHISLVRIRKEREQNNLPNPPLSHHMVFSGNPGTGKTAVARILGELLHAIGLLSKGQLIEADRTTLVAGYIGQTAIQTAEVVSSAIGGVLFIDEAYTLAPDSGRGRDFGQESIDTLLKMMEDHRDDLIVIVAGYGDKMKHFINSNPGLESRFKKHFEFEDYNGSELYEIFMAMCEKAEYMMTEKAERYVYDYFCALYNMRGNNFGNAREVRNYYENVVTAQAKRLDSLAVRNKDILSRLTNEDIIKAALTSNPDYQPQIFNQEHTETAKSIRTAVAENLNLKRAKRQNKEAEVDRQRKAEEEAAAQKEKAEREELLKHIARQVEIAAAEKVEIEQQRKAEAAKKKEEEEKKAYNSTHHAVSMEQTQTRTKSWEEALDAVHNNPSKSPQIERLYPYHDTENRNRGVKVVTEKKRKKRKVKYKDIEKMFDFERESRRKWRKERVKNCVMYIAFKPLLIMCNLVSFTAKIAGYLAIGALAYGVYSAVTSESISFIDVILIASPFVIFGIHFVTKALAEYFDEKLSFI